MVGFHDLRGHSPDLSGHGARTLGILASRVPSTVAAALIQSRPLLRRPAPPWPSSACPGGGCRRYGNRADSGHDLSLKRCGFATSGLLLVWFAIRARYGDVDLRALGGMVYPMPRFSILLALLALAALACRRSAYFPVLSMLLLPTFYAVRSSAIIMPVWPTARGTRLNWCNNSCSVERT